MIELTPREQLYVGVHQLAKQRKEQFAPEIAALLEVARDDNGDHAKAFADMNALAVRMLGAPKP